MKCKIMITISILLLMVIIITGIRAFALPTSKYQIIKKFEQNKELFEKSIEELSSEEYIYFEKDGEKVSITKHKYIDNKVNISYIKEDEFYKYEQTINLIKILDIKAVDKTRGNTEFLFSSSFVAGGKSISYITDLEDYIYAGNKIGEKQQILERWYYIVAMSL